METTATTNFIIRSFQEASCNYKVLITQELNPITLLPTGVFMGTFISSLNGTCNFKFHKNKMETISNLDRLYPGVTNGLYNIIKSLEKISPGYSEEYLPTRADIESPQNFTLSSFNYRQANYKIAITPQLISGIYGLDYTGIFLVSLIFPEEGTKQFEFFLDDNRKFMPADNLNGMDTGLIVEIVKVIEGAMKAI